MTVDDLITELSALHEDIRSQDVMIAPDRTGEDKRVVQGFIVDREGYWSANEIVVIHA